jgi:hypothetical protein
MPPHYLYPAQHDSWRRTVAALRQWNGALLAEPVGSGKTWLALAVAQTVGTTAVAVVPAILQRQWLDTAARVGIALEVHSHERVSRGLLPKTSSGLIVIDEAHRFRNLTTRRAITIAPWLTGRQVLLLTGTPLVNRRRDIVALLQLMLSDDALRLDGIASLRALAGWVTPPIALRRVVIRSQGDRPIGIIKAVLHPGPVEVQRCQAAIEAVARLALGSDPGTRRLITSVLLDAAASSAAAWRESLQRYRALLLQARDSGGFSRRALRQFAGEALDQLVMWPLLPPDSAGDRPPIEDLKVVTEILAERWSDRAWLEDLTSRLDGTVTICFCRHVATAISLARHLGDQVAWIIGQRAGIGLHGMARDVVLAAFGPGRSNWQARRNLPTILVTTEVASEGLDLQSAGRVVHVDLPWTSVRIDQRDGRVRRLGQARVTVESWRRMPATCIEAALGIGRAVATKRSIAESWLAKLVDGPAASLPRSNQITIARTRQCRPWDTAVLVTVSEGEQAGTIWLSCRELAWESHPVEWLSADELADLAEPSPTDIRLAMDLLPTAIRAAITSTRPVPPMRAALITRVMSEARRAASQRDQPALLRLDRMLATLRHQGALGLERQIIALAAADGGQLRAASLPAPPQNYAACAIPRIVLLANHAES